MWFSLSFLNLSLNMQSATGQAIISTFILPEFSYQIFFIQKLPALQMLGF